MTRLHYAWVIALTGALTVFAALGLGRFALGMLLPSMGADLGLNYAQMGLIGTANFVGYLLAVLGCGRAVARFGTRRTVVAALALVGLSLLLVGRSDGFVAVLVLYLLTGVGSGAANVPVMGLVGHWFAPRLRGRGAGIMVIGSGLAIMLSGVLIPLVNAHWGGAGWRVSWSGIGVLIVLIAVLAAVLLRDTPAERGLRPYGAVDGPRRHDAAPVFGGLERRRVLLRLAAIYFLFGFTYVIYATFIVTTLVSERGLPEASAGQVWFWIGFFSLFSGPLFGWLSDHAGRNVGMACVFALHAGAYLLAALPLPIEAVYASVLLFGIAAWSIPGIMAAAVGDYLGPAHAAVAFGQLTFVFGIGQVAGPALAGVLAEARGSFSGAYLLAALLAAVAMLLALRLRPPG